MDVTMPQLGETVTEATVTRWYKAVGDPVAVGETLYEVSTDKVDSEITAPTSGVLGEIVVPEGATAPVGARLAVIAEAAVSAPTVPVAPATAPTAPAPPSEAMLVPTGPTGPVTSPLVRRMLAEERIDPASLTGSGEGGRITREDVLAAVRARGTRVGGPERAPREPGDEVVPFDRIRRQTAEHMTRSLATSAHVFTSVRVDFERVDRVRRAAQAEWRARALARAIRDLADRARAKRLGPDDVVGGTFTITNMGPFGTAQTYAIINQPQVAILAADGVRKEPVVVEGPEGEDAIVAHHVGMLSLSWDHRAFDGAYAAAFLNALRGVIEHHDWEAELA
ncbi:MAG: dihydrolipoamide acetyltransferase family protein [Actinomycetota bacterium]